MIVSANVVMGVDLGGTHLRYVAATPSGNVLEARSGAAVGPAEIGALVRRQASALNRPVLGLHVAAAGASAPERNRSLREAIAASSHVPVDRISVGADVEAAYRAALDSRPGVLLLAGTGSVAWGRGSDGRCVRRGGLGPILDDRGSGFDLGLRALRSTVAALDGIVPRTHLTDSVLKTLGPTDARGLAAWARDLPRRRRKIASLSVAVVEAWRTGDPEARRHVERGARDLARLVIAVAEELGVHAPDVAFEGGVLRGARDYADLVRSLLDDRGLDATFVATSLPPVGGALLIALDNLESPDRGTWRKNVEDTFPRTFDAIQATV